jgi:thiol-disulfide isomerase/thioredoxin
MRRVPALVPLFLVFPALLAAAMVGKPAPAFSVRGLDGKAWTQDGAGHTCVLVDFWASWCQPCLQEIPALNALQARHRGRLQVLGLSLDKGGEAGVRAAAARRGVAYAVAPVDPKVAEAYGVQGFPSAFLLRDGIVLKVLTGKRALPDFERDLGPYLR